MALTVRAAIAGPRRDSTSTTRPIQGDGSAIEAMPAVLRGKKIREPRIATMAGTSVMATSRPTPIVTAIAGPNIR